MLGWRVTSNHSKGKPFGLIKLVRNGQKTAEFAEHTAELTRLRIEEAVESYELQLANSLVKYNLQLLVMPYDFEKFWELIKTRKNPPP
jgi:hypothetical protein